MRNAFTQSRGSTANPAAPHGVPAVSIIVPTYNRLNLLKASLDSIAHQTFGDYEIIVVDDGSTDGTRQYIADNEPAICYHWQPNQGAAEARNHGLRVTHSEFVAFLDSDDLWDPRFLEAAVTRLRQHPDEALVYTDFVSMTEHGRSLHGHRKRPHGGDVTASLFASTFIHTSAVVARAHIIRDAGGFDGRLSHNEDYDLWLRLSLRHEFGLIKEPLCHRRCHRDSLSRNGCGPDILLRKADLLARFFNNGGKPKIDEALARKRLAKVYYTAGKAYLRTGQAGEARDTFRRSIEFMPARGKTWLWYLGARLSYAFHPRSNGQDTATPGSQSSPQSCPPDPQGNSPKEKQNTP